MKPNDIVYNKRDAVDGGFVPYGRISRIIAPDHFETIFGRHVINYHKDELVVVTDYKGRWLPHKLCDIWRPMPSLRKLKQCAAWGNKNVWKKNRKKLAKKSHQALDS